MRSLQSVSIRYSSTDLKTSNHRARIEFMGEHGCRGIREEKESGGGQ